MDSSRVSSAWNHADFDAIRTLADINDLPVPSRASYGELSEEQAADALTAVMNIWRSVLERRTDMIGESTDSVDEQWRRASLVLACHFSFLMGRAEGPFLYSNRAGWSPFLARFQHDLLTLDYGDDAAIERRLLSEFCRCWWSSFFMEKVGTPAAGRAPASYDIFVFWGLEDISKVALSSPHPEHARMAHHMVRALSYRSRGAVERRDAGDIEFRDATWGDAVTLRELPSLAQRSDSMIQKYGEKNVESKFEEYLRRLIQSFGFMVIPTIPGQRRVDLICISSAGGSDPYTLLIEAKSTRNKYALPTKDSRAIEEYIRTVRSVLGTLPPLKMVLVVGPTPAETIGGKIRDLSARTPVPVRYCTVDALIYLHHSLRGVLPARQFLNHLNAADGVVAPSDLRRIVSTYRETEAAHGEFVSRLLKGS